MTKGIINNIQNLRLKYCRCCNQKFQPNHPAKVFCSKECKTKYRKMYKKIFDINNREEINEYSKIWNKNNRKSIGKNRRKRIIILRRKILELLGNKCNNPNCPIPLDRMDKRALHIDHINGGGTEERKQFDSEMYYRHVLKQIQSGSKEYQLLCAYCNWLKRYKSNEIESCWI